MATSGTYAFAPSLGELTIAALARLQIMSAQILPEHMSHAQREANLWLVEVANRGPNLFTVDLQTQVLSNGVASYSIPAETVMILDPYIDQGSPARSYVLTPLSRSVYASIPYKGQLGTPNQFWFDRTVAPTVKFWPVPDADATYTFRYYRYRRMQDAKLTNATEAELQYRFLDAFVAGLAFRLARIFKPELEEKRERDAEKAWAICAQQDTENAPMTMIPMVGGYFR